MVSKSSECYRDHENVKFKAKLGARSARGDRSYNAMPTENYNLNLRNVYFNLIIQQQGVLNADNLPVYSYYLGHFRAIPELN